MNKPNYASPVPLKVRDACLQGLADLIPDIVKIAKEEKNPSLKLSAFDKLGKYGLSGRKVVVVENAAVMRICLELWSEASSPTEDQYEAFGQRLRDEVEALGGSDIEEGGGPEESGD